MMLINPHRNYGFTLLELLIAISIFSVLSVMAYGGLKTVLDARESSDKVAGRVAESQLAMLRLANDLRQTVNRGVRDNFGTPVASMLNRQDESELEWTRAGYSNFGKRKRTNLQRISYKISRNEELNTSVLVRVSWPTLDRVQGTESSESILLSDIESLEWRFNDSSNNWGSDWPPSVAANQTSSLPRAVEVNITFSDLGEVRRLILIPQG